MMRRVSTHFCNSVMPLSAMRMRRWPSKWNGLVTTPTVRMPRSRATLAMTGPAPVPVPPPMPAVTNTMCEPERRSRISSITSSAAARPTSGCDPAPRPSVTCTPICTMRSAFDMVSAWASVLATTKSTPCKPALIMLLTAFPPAPPTPNTVIRGLSSRMSGMFRLIVMVASSSLCRRFRRPAPAGPPPAAVMNWFRVWGPSETLAKPSSDSGEIAARTCLGISPAARFEMFEMRGLRINKESCRDSEGRTLGGVRQSGNAKRPSDAYRPAENASGKIGQSGELARAAGQDDAAALLRREGGRGKPVAHHFKDFFDPRLDDRHQRRARDELGLFALVVVDRRHRDHVALVRSAGEHAAIQRLDSLGVGHARVQAAREIHGDVLAAESEAVEVNEAAAGEYRERRGAGAHIDDGGAEIGLVVGENRKAGDVGTGDHRLDVEMAALDREHQIARGGDIGRRNVHVNAEFSAEAGARIADAVGPVDRIAHGQRMQHGAAVALRMAAAGGEHARDIAFGNAGADDLDVGGEHFAGEASRRNRQHDRLDLDLCHAFGGIDRLADHLFGLRQIDDTAGLHAARAGVAEADHFDGVAPSGQNLLR